MNSNQLLGIIEHTKAILYGDSARRIQSSKHLLFCCEPKQRAPQKTAGISSGFVKGLLNMVPLEHLVTFTEHSVTFRVSFELSRFSSLTQKEVTFFESSFIKHFQPEADVRGYKNLLKYSTLHPFLGTEILIETPLDVVTKKP
jgi:hypothetical protein